MIEHEFKILHPFCGIGGSALGSSAARVSLGGGVGRFRNVGGIDFNADACADFGKLTGVPALQADIHELTPADLLKYCPERPDVAMSSPPCKGFSALLGDKVASQDHYQKMNMLLIKSLFLLLSTWDRPPDLFFYENVPRIGRRGKHVIDQADQLLRAEGYAVSYGNHDCGEIGGLAQHRRRWFMIARRYESVKRFIYHVKSKRVLACGDVIGPMPLPGDVEAAGPMHSVPNLSWKNWVRLSLIPAGGDWRDLSGVLKEGQKRRELFRRLPLSAWDQPTAAVTGPGGSNIGYVQDPRVEIARRALAVSAKRNDNLGVVGFAQASGTITGETWPTNGRFSVADPRIKIVRRNPTHPLDICISVVGRELPDSKETNWQQVAGVTAWEATGPTVSSSATIHSGSFQIADPRWLELHCKPRAGTYGVMRWQDAAGTITASMSIDNSRAAIADPRLEGININRSPKFTPVIVSNDDCWHRPFTTLELAKLQSFPTVIDGKPLVLTGTSHTRWREGIGNAVPPAASEAICEQLLIPLLGTKIGVPTIETGPVWADRAEASFPV